MLQPLLGIAALIAIAWGLSTNRKKVRWRPLLVGLGLQFTLAFLILKTPLGHWFFDGAQSFFQALIGYAKEGARGVLGPTALGLEGDAPILGAVILVTVVFFSALFALAHHLGLVRLVVSGMARAMARTMGTSGAESTCAAANIFVGQTESPLLIRPYLAKMTSSELGAVMTVGFATVAGGVFALYVEVIGDSIPGIAGHLLAASVMSAPMALGLAKVVFPETEDSDTMGRDAAQPKSEYANLLDAAARGAGDGMKLALNILGMLIAFLGLLALVNGGLEGLFGSGASLQGILGVIFAPFAWLLGVPMGEARAVGELLGTKMAVNEYVAFLALAEAVPAGSESAGDAALVLGDRSRIIASYALCGFSNLSSIAIQIGGIGTLAPGRRGELARLGLRAMATGTLASWSTAATAALLVG